MHNIINESYDIFKRHKKGENLSNDDLKKVKDNKEYGENKVNIN